MATTSTTRDTATTWSVPKRRARRGAKLESAPKQRSGIVTSKPPAVADIPVSWRIVGKRGEIAAAARGMLTDRQPIATSCRVGLRCAITEWKTQAGWT